MPRRVILIVALFLVALPLFGKIGTNDIVPASTLLVPHFEIDLDPAGQNMLIGIQNASATAALAHVTFWTDYGIPTQSFDIYLTGFDQETIDLRQAFQGAVPITASDGQDPEDTISNQGLFSQDINFASCTGYLGPMSAWENTVDTAALIAAHRGEADPEHGGNCVGRNHGDGLLRGFITIDTVTQCNAGLPTSPGYFSSFRKSFQNILFGDYTIVDGEGRMYSEAAVHIESSYPVPLPNSFYGHIDGGNGAMFEPLPTAWASTFMNGRTDVDYYRHLETVPAAFPCGSDPSEFPVPQRQASAVDREGTITSLGVTELFPWASGISTIADGAAPKLGWLFLNLNRSEFVMQQSWVTFRTRPEALPESTPFGFAIPGAQVANTNSSQANPSIP